MALRPGTVFGGEYVIARPIARGGMGAVYAAVQKSTGAERALKVMHPSLVGDDRLRAMFDREARASARIESDHVVQVLAAGVDEASGSPWLVMEMLEGETLAEAVARGPLPLADVARIVAELGHALGAAHQALDPLVHRDLKPENVFLAKTKREGEAWTVKLLDFGIAKVLDGARGAGTTLPAGTPLWMAPEQAEAAAVVTPATDVWALGLVAFHALTGRPYWRAASVAPNVSAAALLKEILFEPIVAASARAEALGVGGLVTPGFDTWFAGCVARAPSDRYPDAGSARQAFDELVGGAALGATVATPHGSPRAVVTPAGAASSSGGAATPATAALAQPVAPSRRLRWLGRAVVLAVAIGGSLALFFRPARLETAHKAGRAPTDRGLAVAERSTTAWATALLAAPPPSRDDAEAMGVRRGALELLVESRFVPSALKSPALTELAHMPAGNIAPSVVRAIVLEKAFPTIRRCFEDERAHNPQLRSAKIEVAFSIQKDGSVTDPLVSDGTVREGPFAVCVLRAFAGLRFPEPKDVVTIRYPIAFGSD